MAGISYDTLVTMIRSYTEVDDTVFTTAILENFPIILCTLYVLKTL